MAEHVEWDELAVGLALGALEPEEEQTLLEHMRGCEQCARTVVEMEAAAAGLAYGVEAVEPPPSVLASILAEARKTEQTRPPVVRLDQVHARIPDREIPRRREAPSLSIAAALIALLLVGGWTFKLRQEREISQGSLTKISALVADPRTQQVKLTSSTGEQATVLLNGVKSYLVVDKFKQNKSGDSIYVLWAQQPAGQMTGVQSFKVVHDGPNLIPIANAGDASAIKAFAVSKENGPKIPATPSTPIAIGPVSAT
jgi:hypothetical protein